VLSGVEPLLTYYTGAKDRVECGRPGSVGGEGGRVLVDEVMAVSAVDLSVLSVLGDGEEELELRGELLFRVQAVGEVYSARERRAN
jgi:hypothetical protein